VERNLTESCDGEWLNEGVGSKRVHAMPRVRRGGLSKVGPPNMVACFLRSVDGSHRVIQNN
jgi:hypothetical protein